MEDSFGHAFAGKYESVFCVNTGTPEDRLASFENAIRCVYASCMDESALAYRRQRGLEESDEQMAILVQRVSGSLFGHFFLPAAAGVSYSFNAWKWHESIECDKGMIRLVAGLGTRAVDRTDSDYPRLIALGRPDLHPTYATDSTRYCQRSIDLLNLESGELETRSLDDVLPWLSPFIIERICEEDENAQRYLAEKGTPRPVYVATCSGIAKESGFIEDISRILLVLQTEYKNPVDIEFTVNWNFHGERLINLLQCRPLQMPSIPTTEHQPAQPLDAQTIATIPPSSVFFFLESNVMGPQTNLRLDLVVTIDPQQYWELPWKEKPTVARQIGAINSYAKENGLSALLVAPGRIGTTSPELGVPVRFAEIDGFCVVCERAWDQGGYRPELSFGSHFFQDLVESEIFYAGIPDYSSEVESGGVYNTAFFNNEINLYASIVPDSSLPPSLISVWKVQSLTFISDIVRGTCLCARLT